MAVSLQFNFKALRSLPQDFHLSPRNRSFKFGLGLVKCSAASPTSKRSYSITLLPGDGIGPEVTTVAKNVLDFTGSLEGIKFNFREMLLGGAALDETGVPLPDETLSVAKQSDAILLGAIGGYKWDKNEKRLKPETGLLQLREGLKVYANLRPAIVFPQLMDASTLKREIVDGVDLVVVRELTGGIYFGKPRGFSTDENGEESGFNTEIYTTSGPNYKT
ncbi:hypothetical protein QN277_017501 [Acacia crassicarpa]|uniref:Isopropylmalate dehydrogenase-like domain-containing protein n=1 Tax=Acacia crassicarpa TaxID=499986 RepID=A0AAE1JTR8_9FABA|nr:hypothetical protein QN277_017501 [Acacia crassicarpa]